MFGPASLQEENVEPAVPVGVEHRPAAVHGLRHEVLAGRTALVGERQPDGVGHVLEPVEIGIWGLGRRSAEMSMRADGLHPGAHEQKPNRTDNGRQAAESAGH